MIKIDLITGFLGSGKTTFIREYAKYLLQKGEKICIIENDYGAVNIDMVLLQDLYGDNCNLEMIVGGDGQEAHRRRFRTKLISMGMSGYDRVIIEPSGIYDVDEFFDVLYDEPLDRWYEIGNVISIVDAGLIEEIIVEDGNASNPDAIETLEKAADNAEGSAFHTEGALDGISRYLFMSEIACAGKVVISKLQGAEMAINGQLQGTEVAITGKLQNTESAIQIEKEKVASCVNRIMAEYGLGSTDKPWFDEDKSFVAKPFGELTAEDFESIESCGYRHASYVKLPLEDKQFTPLFYFDVEISEEKLREKVEALFKDEKAGKVIRVKGFVKVGNAGASGQIEINATEKGLKIAPVVSSRNVLIIIGERLNKEYINEFWRDYCSVVSL